MSDLYNRIQDLCQKKGISIGKMCNELGISRGNLTELKMERIRTLQAENLTKISRYFNVSIGYLLGTEQEKAPTPEGERPILEGTYFRLAKGAQELGLDDDDVDTILKLYSKHREKNQ